MTGTDVMNGLIDAATQLGFMVHHETDSRRTNPGFPDLVIVGHGTLLVIECKSKGERLAEPKPVKRRGRLHVLPGQRDWLDAFAGANVWTAVVRPDDAQISDLEAGLDEWQELHYSDALNVLAKIRSLAM